MENLVHLIGSGSGSVNCSGLAGSAGAHVVDRLVEGLENPIMVLTADLKAAEQVIQDLRFAAGARERKVVLFPPYHVLPYQTMAPNADSVADRIRILYDLATGARPDIVVAPVEAVLQKVMPASELADFAELVMAGEDLDRDQLVSKMIAGGYQRTTLVEEPGDFALRGGILDLFSPHYPDPVRIEFFGDQVESIRFFSASDQRKKGDVGEVVVLPAKEMLFPRHRADAIIGRIRHHLSELGYPVTKGRELVERIREEGVHPGMDGQLSLVYESSDTLLDYLPSRTTLVVNRPGGCKAAAERLFERLSMARAAAIEEKRLAVPVDDLFLGWEDVAASKFPKVFLRDVALGQEENPLFFDIQGNDTIRAELKSRTDAMQPLLPLVKWLDARKREGAMPVIVCSVKSQVERVVELLSGYKIDVRQETLLPDFKMAGPDRRPVVCEGRLSAGFVWKEMGLALITEDEIFGAKKRRKKVKKSSAKERFLSLEELHEGDVVVHGDHGLGRYEGMEKLRFNGVMSDFLLIGYRDGDRLYLPVDRMGMIQKYIGMDGVDAQLDKMGGKSWDKVKEKAKASVEMLAGELLKLYAARQVRKGHSFSPVDSLFRDFEAAFPYEETPDQLKAIDQVLADMQSAEPMDRLVCGDVGYGKTEVALRATFRAVSDSRQVAVLVPTTVLAEQHLRTFEERFANYPITVVALDRFRKPREQRAIVAGLADGSIDVVIGTHRLLQKDVAFKSLGLVVIDEEQRFGVRHKEKLKKFRETVDVLALSATPIPRTLHMSLMGIRDITVIATPPEERQAIRTYVSQYDETVIRDAVARELERDGQIFFVHNTIHSIEKVAGRLAQILPEIPIGVAHGRMKEEDLENEMLKFIKKETRILVCTTIIESGLDIPGANTMIVNRADRFGLSQLYQLRGRIGRGDAQAYAYLFVPEEERLSKDATRRLKVLLENSDLGSGFQIAMSDLQIRGGGAALGANQSGHIAAVGYDMFLQLMENAVSELKGQPVVEALEPEITFTLNAYIPEEYIPDIDQRLGVYRKLARALEPSDVSAIKDEMVDRYGPLPSEASSLLAKIRLRVYSVKAG